MPASTRSSGQWRGRSWGSIAKNCLYNQRQILSSVPAALALDLIFLHTPPWETEPWKSIFPTNTPGANPTGVPILITQGDTDAIMPPATTAALAGKLCTQGETVDLRMLPDTAHLDAGQVAVPQVVEWIADRFAGKRAPTTCK